MKNELISIKVYTVILLGWLSDIVPLGLGMVPKTGVKHAMDITQYKGGDDFS